LEGFLFLFLKISRFRQIAWFLAVFWTLNNFQISKFHLYWLSKRRLQEYLGLLDTCLSNNLFIYLFRVRYSISTNDTSPKYLVYQILLFVFKKYISEFLFYWKFQHSWK
jgi:hypothetical protein